MWFVITVKEDSQLGGERCQPWHHSSAAPLLPRTRRGRRGPRPEPTPQAGGGCPGVGLDRAGVCYAPGRSSPSVRGWGDHGF